MGNCTYENTDKTSTRETYEWTNTWIEHTENTETPRVLYIGDSISGATREAANREADGRVLFDRLGTSKALDNPYFFDDIRVFARQQGKRAAVVFNNGLHGWHLSDEDEYAKAYERTVRFLLEEFKDTPIYLILTTQVGHEARKGRVAARNEAVKAIAAKYGLPIIDFYSLSIERADFLSGDLVHFKPEGYSYYGRLLLDSLAPVLGES